MSDKPTLLIADDERLKFSTQVYKNIEIEKLSETEMTEFHEMLFDFSVIFGDFFNKYKDFICNLELNNRIDPVALFDLTKFLAEIEIDGVLNYLQFSRVKKQKKIGEEIPIPESKAIN